MFNLSKSSNVDFLIAGLGNPGFSYDFTRHNVGFMLIDSFEFTDFYFKFNSLLKKVELYDKNVILIKPQTFMNLSGSSINDILNFYKLDLKKLILIYDNIYLDLEKIKIKINSSHGGHNGVKNVIELLGSSNFIHIKIGIGNKMHSNMKLNDWVLSKFSDKEKRKLVDVFEKVRSTIEFIFKGNIEKAMNKYN